MIDSERMRAEMLDWLTAQQHPARDKFTADSELLSALESMVRFRLHAMHGEMVLPGHDQLAKLQLVFLDGGVKWREVERLSLDLALHISNQEDSGDNPSCHK